MPADPAVKRKRLSIADFDEMLLDKPENEKWELINGQLIKGMVGAVIEHHLIIGNVVFALESHFRRKVMPCRAFRESFYLKKSADDLAALPDVMVRCGSIERGLTSVDDPVVLMEVVSPGSEAKDRAIKRVAYQRLPSLQHFVLISRDEAFIDVYTRRDDGWHSAPPLMAMDALLRLPAIEFEMTVAEVYRDVLEGAGGMT